ncbi:MAG: S-layer homology domain-containing protein [Oscillospiraceae bacterium]|nr:S-layer homology domain-containing protein [Oscillospiraceae bacterium]
MKQSTRRRVLSLLLALIMVFTLVPTALLAGAEEGGESGEESNPPAGSSEDTIFITLRNGATGMSSGDEENPFVLGVEDGPTLSATISALDAGGNPTTTHDDDYIIWKSDDESIAKAVYNTGSDGHTFYVEGVAPGNTKIIGTTATQAGVPTGGEFTLFVTVSGIVPEKKEITIQENETLDLPDAATAPGNEYRINYYGDAAKGAVEISSDRPNIVRAVGIDRNGLTIDAVAAGTAVVTIRAGVRTATITVTVESNDNLAITAETPASISNPLRFSSLEKALDELCQEAIQQEGEKRLVSITNLSVPTAQGTLYLGYNSPEDTGAGVGSIQTLYVRGEPRGPYISDVVFVPNPSYTKEEATITFTGAAQNGRTFKGKIIVKLADARTDVVLTTRTDVPLDLSASNFTTVCQQQTGSPLSYVIFTLPPSSQGVLYRDYKNASDYGSRVLASEKYDRKGLDDITFVPAGGYVGDVTIGYAGYSTTGGKYTGELVIKVSRSLDENIPYQDYGAGEVSFSGADFDSYSEAKTGQPMRTAGWVKFNLPPASQGTLYYRRGGSRETPVRTEDEWSLSQLDYIYFVALEGFNGVVRIPFSGRNQNGQDFSGTVELHIQSNASSSRYGDVSYTCQPDQSVKLQLEDFASLCLSATGQRLHYVTFQALPDFTQGSLFYNRTSSGAIGTRVSTVAKYFNSATPYLSQVSFWAGKSFRRVEIPFTLAAVDGQTITGLLVISSGDGAGNGQTGTVTYATSGQQPVTFTSASFDAACRQATNSALYTLRLSLPASGQGILYYDYREGAAPKAFDPNTTLYCTGGTSIDRVTFVPAKNFAGTVYLTFSATAINGTACQGTVEINVRAGAALGSIVHYTTGGVPVYFQSQDLFAASGIGLPSGIRLTGLPSPSQGQVYYQYISPTQYSWLGNTTSTYSVTGDPSVSNLCFIPKAGYQGRVTIPYVVTGYDGTTSTGSVEIMVEFPAASVNFDDLGGCSAQTRAAVDYLASQGVVNGVGYRTYGPTTSIRRGDFCLMISRAFRFNLGGGLNQSFIDVPYGAYYTQAVQEMYALGVVNGVGGSRFQPEASISRQDAAVMVSRALKKAGLTLPEGSNQAALANYTDRGQVAGYAQDALGSLIRAGLFPVSGNQLEPQAAITRADMALLLHRAMTNFS